MMYILQQEAQEATKRNITQNTTVECHTTSFASESQEKAPSISDEATLNPDNCTGSGSYDLDEEDEVVQSQGLSDAGITCLPSHWQHEVHIAKLIDKICRALFPVMFIFFNLIYWLYYQVLT